MCDKHAIINKTEPSSDAPSYKGNTTYAVVEGLSNYTVMLQLSANPFPKSNFSWFFNGDLLTEVGNGIGLAVDSVAFRIIDRNQAGTYRVQSSNLIGSGEFTFQFIVYCKEGNT